MTELFDDLEDDLDQLTEGVEEDKKRKKVDKDKGDNKRHRGGDDTGAGKRSRHAQRGAADGGDDEDDEGVLRDKRRSREDDGPQGSVDSKEIQADQRDKDFIDDADFLGEGPPTDDEDARLAAAPEAEDATDMLFGKKKKKRKEEDSDKQMSLLVDDKIAKMEAAAELDYDAHDASQPAINKLKMLQEVELFLAQRKYHEMFIHAGGLGVLKAWLEPYKDSTLPNVRVRQAVLTCCKLLPIDTARDDIRENLKKSQLASRVMFLSKCPVETQSNRKLAVELCAKWARPIFFDPDAEAEKKRAREEALRRARAAAQEQQRLQEEAAASSQAADPRKIKYGQQGYRWHAAIPQAMKLDYVIPAQSQVAANPESAVSQAAATVQQANAGKKSEGRFSKVMRSVQRRQRGSNARAAVPSVEGRHLHV